MASNKLTFKLHTDFIEKVKTWDNPFKDNPLGELVYKRTYSRAQTVSDGHGRLTSDDTNEVWYQTIQRVVEGTYSIMKEHIQSIGKDWDDSKAQRSAQEMYDLIYHMKFLPPGRGLFCMGTPLVHEKGLGMALNNCGFISTKDILGDPTKPFGNIMDGSMCGTGYGFDTKGANKLKLYEPEMTANQLGNTYYTIPDTREGWVESLKVLLNSYFIENEPEVIFKYHEIRPKGEKLKTFGGVSSGPEPLIEMHNKLREILSIEVKKGKLSSTGIVNICNLIGVCVVSGGIRRTALIAFGDENDEKFLDLKNYEKNPDRAAYGWTSNNSIMAKIGQDYIKIQERILINGEPGLFWREPARERGRFADAPNGKDRRADGSNPCFSIDTPITTSKGIRTIKELLGKPFVAVLDGKEYPSTEEGFFQTASDQQLYKLELDNGLTVRATANHKFVTPEGLVELEDLSVGDDVCLSDNTGYKWKGGIGTEEEGYLMGWLIGDGTFAGEYRVRMVAISEMAQKYGIKPREKNVYEQGSYEFTKGLIQSFFDTDGNVNIHRDKNGGHIRLHQVYKDRLEAVQRLLFAMGIGSKIYKSRDGDVRAFPDRNVESATKALYQLNISKDNIFKFRNIIGFRDNDKRRKLDECISSYTKGMYKYEYISKVKSITEDEIADTYCCTIPGPHRIVVNGIMALQCVEQTLQSYEVCCLVETFIAKHITLEEFLRTLKYSFLYAKTVTLVMTHVRETNEVIKANRRIGSSLSGIAQFLGQRNIEDLRIWCNEGYNIIQHWDEIYSEWFDISKSIKTTSIKPSGTVSLLAGASPGVHYPNSRYYLRRVRMTTGSPLIEELKQKGYHVESCAVAPLHTQIVSFPIDVGECKTLDDVTMHEQLEMAAFMQHWYADNQVSCTVTFRPEEGKHIAAALNTYQYRLKGISFLPRSDGVYQQMPYEKITKEQYEEENDKIKRRSEGSDEPPTKIRRTEDPDATAFCDGETCTLNL